MRGIQMTGLGGPEVLCEVDDGMGKRLVEADEGRMVDAVLEMAGAEVFTLDPAR